MFKNLTLITMISLFGANASAITIDSRLIKAYGIPCAITIAAGAALIKNNGLEIGAATCIAISASTFINSPVKKTIELEDKILAFQEDFWNRAKLNANKNKEEISYFKDQIRKVIAKKIIESQLKVDERVVEYLNSKEFKISVRNEMMVVLKDHYPAIDKVIKRSIQKNMDKTIDEVTKKVTTNILNTTYAKVDKESLNDAAPEEESKDDKATESQNQKSDQKESALDNSVSNTADGE